MTKTGGGSTAITSSVGMMSNCECAWVVYGFYFPFRYGDRRLLLWIKIATDMLGVRAVPPCKWN